MAPGVAVEAVGVVAVEWAEVGPVEGDVEEVAEPAVAEPVVVGAEVRVEAPVARAAGAEARVEAPVARAAGAEVRVAVLEAVGEVQQAVAAHVAAEGADLPM